MTLCDLIDFCSVCPERSDLRGDLLADGDGVPLLVRVPNKDAGALRPGRRGVPGLPRALVLRVVRALPDVSRAQEPRLRHGDR